MFLKEIVFFLRFCDVNDGMRAERLKMSRQGG